MRLRARVPLMRRGSAPVVLAALLAAGASRSGVVISQEAARMADDSLRYLGQPLAGDKPVVFAPGDVSTDARELGIVFAADGRELYYTRLVGKLPTLLRRRLVEARGPPRSASRWSPDNQTPTIRIPRSRPTASVSTSSVER